MKMKLKYIFLVLSIITIIITIVLFVDFVRNDLNKNDAEDNVISQLFDKKWLRTGLSVYENGELIDENLYLPDERYMIFDENKVTYCNPVSSECNSYNYLYNKTDNTIFFDSENYFVENGTYDIFFYDEKFDLTLKEEDIVVVYHFDTQK